MELGRYYNRRSQLVPFINDRRLQHTLFIGRRQTGKTTALERIALDDIHAGEPVVYFGHTVLSHVPEERVLDTIYFAPEWGRSFAFNILAGIPEHRRALFADTFLATVKGIWGYDIPTPTLDMYVRAGIATLLAEGRSTLPSLKELLTNEEHRKTIVGRVEDTVLKDFWRDFDALPEKDRRQEIASTMNKIYAFLLEPMVRDSISQKQNHVSFTDTVFIANLSDIGGENKKLLGALLLTQLYIEGANGLSTNLFVDDAEPYAAILERIMADCPNISVTYSLRRYSPLADSAATVVAFRTSVRDAARLEPEFGITGTEARLYELPRFEANVATSGGFERLHMEQHRYTLTPLIEKKIIRRCRDQYMRGTLNGY